MTEQELISQPKPNMFLFSVESLRVSRKNINKTIRRFTAEANNSTDQEFVKSKRAKISKLKIIASELKTLIEIL